MSEKSLNIESMTVADYIKGVSGGITLSDETVAIIILKRKISLDALVSELDKKTLDLICADVYMACANMPSVKVSVEDQDGNWKHKESGGQITDSDKSRWVSTAKKIYAMYGEISYISSGPRIHAMGMRTWRIGNGC